MARILGIDLGTTNSAVAVLNTHGEAEMVPNREGDYITPSVVFFEGDEPIVGSVAKHSAPLEPSNVVQLVKRQMGNPEYRFVSESGTTYPAEKISGIILRRLKEDAESAPGEIFTHAVITVPAYFSDAQRQATIDAGNIAGLKVPRIINEPTAAALAYGVEANANGNVLVYALGGGTFDVTILEVAPLQLTVLATGGDRNLGGYEWDNRIMVWVNERFMEAGGVDLLADPRTELELRDKAEQAKKALSAPNLGSTKIVPSGGGVNKPITLTLRDFESITNDLLDRTEVYLEGVLEDAGLRWSDLEKILLVGGSTRMKAVPVLIERVTGRKASRELHPDHVVALGAAIQAGKLAAEMPEFRASVTHAQQAPSGDQARRSDPTRGINLVEWEINDVTAHSVGMIALNEFAGQWENYVVLKRNSGIPSAASRNFVTLFDNQAVLIAKITQGEDSNPEYVTIIGEATLQLPFSRPKGTPFTVEVSCDADGIVHARFVDPTTGNSFGKVDVDRRSNLSPEEVIAQRSHLRGLSVG